MNNFILDALLELSEESRELRGLYSFLEDISSVIKTIAFIGFIIFMIQCLFGYKLIKFWIAMQGFIIGGLLTLLFTAPAFHGSIPKGILIILIGALIGAWLAFKLYKIGVFLHCFLIGFLITAFLGLSIDASAAVILGLIGGIVLGIIGVKLIQPVFILSTAIGGGLTAGSFLGTILDSDSTQGFLLSLLCIGIGLYVQIKMNGGLFENHNKPIVSSYTGNPMPPVHIQEPVELNTNQNIKIRCQYCGSINEEKNKFCIKCGKEINKWQNDSVSEVAADTIGEENMTE